MKKFIVNSKANLLKGGAVVASSLLLVKESFAAISFSTADAVTDVGTVGTGLMTLGVAIVGIAVVWGLVKKA